MATILQSIEDINNRLTEMGAFFNLEDGSSLEEYNLIIYARALANHGILDFPFRYEKRESPDFAISFNGSTCGVEITHTVIKDHFKNLKLERENPGSIVEIGSNGVSYYRAPGEPLSCSPFLGYSAEAMWVSLVEETLSKKLITLNKEHYAKMDKNILLIRNFTNLPIRSKNIINCANSICEGNFTELFTNFDEVTVIWGDRLIIQHITKSPKILKVE